MKPDECPHCTAPAKHVEVIGGGVTSTAAFVLFYCRVCGKTFKA